MWHLLMYYWQWAVGAGACEGCRDGAMDRSVERVESIGAIRQGERVKWDEALGVPLHVDLRRLTTNQAKRGDSCVYHLGSDE